MKYNSIFWWSMDLVIKKYGFAVLAQHFFFLFFSGRDCILFLSGREWVTHCDSLIFTPKMSKEGVRLGDFVQLYFIFSVEPGFGYLFEIFFLWGYFLVSVMIDWGTGWRACFCESHFLFVSLFWWRSWRIENR